MSGASKRRQSSSEDEGGGASWMDTYGDLVTLLLCFFVLLFSFSSVDAAKWEALAGAFSGSNAIVIPGLDPSTGFEDPITRIPRTPSDEEVTPPSAEDLEKMQQEYDDFMQLYLNISAYVDMAGIDALVEPDFDSYEVTISFSNDILFDSGYAVIREDMVPSLDHMVDIMEQEMALISMIHIEGHTDNVPIAAGNTRFKNNWQLSSARSDAVLEYVFETERIDPKKLSGSCYGEYHPVLDNDTEEGRSRNRRVDFIFKAYKTL